MDMKIGTVIKTPSMALRVTKIVGRNVMCDYWDSAAKEWKPRGYAENSRKLRERIASGQYEVAND